MVWLISTKSIDLLGESVNIKILSRQTSVAEPGRALFRSLPRDGKSCCTRLGHRIQHIHQPSTSSDDIYSCGLSTNIHHPPSTVHHPFIFSQKPPSNHHKHQPSINQLSSTVPGAPADCGRCRAAKAAGLRGPGARGARGARRGGAGCGCGGSCCGRRLGGSVEILLGDEQMMKNDEKSW